MENRIEGKCYFKVETKKIQWVPPKSVAVNCEWIQQNNPPWTRAGVKRLLGLRKEGVPWGWTRCEMSREEGWHDDGLRMKDNFRFTSAWLSRNLISGVNYARFWWPFLACLLFFVPIKNSEPIFCFLFLVLLAKDKDDICGFPKSQQLEASNVGARILPSFFSDNKVEWCFVGWERKRRRERVLGFCFVVMYNFYPDCCFCRLGTKQNCSSNDAPNGFDCWELMRFFKLCFFFVFCTTFGLWIHGEFKNLNA